MALLARIIRLFKADINGVMDQIEDQGLLLKQHLRDMEASLVQKETKLKKMGFAMDQAQQAYKKGKKETDNLELDLEVAIKKDKDDIARMLIKKLNPLTRIDQQRLQYEQLKQKATEYFYRIEKQNWENTWSAMPAGLSVNDLSEEEVELELLQRKDAIKGGVES